MDSPRISVIIPIYNSEDYLAESIKSVTNQSYQPHEIIVIDDGSSDSSAKVAQSFEDAVNYYFQPNAGIAAARNLGVEKASGNFFAFLDGDDSWTTDKLSLQIAAFAADPSFEIVFGHLEHFISPELDTETKKKIHCPEGIMTGIHCGAMLVKKDVFLRVGSFEKNIEVGEFISWYLRAKELGLSINVIPKLVMRRGIHMNNTMLHKRESMIEYTHIIKASLDRRRKILGQATK